MGGSGKAERAECRGACRWSPAYKTAIGKLPLTAATRLQPPLLVMRVDGGGQSQPPRQWGLGMVERAGRCAIPNSCEPFDRLRAGPRLPPRVFRVFSPPRHVLTDGKTARTLDGLCGGSLALPPMGLVEKMFLRIISCAPFMGQDLGERGNLGAPSRSACRFSGRRPSPLPGMMGDGGGPTAVGCGEVETPPLRGQRILGRHLPFAAQAGPRALAK